MQVEASDAVPCRDLHVPRGNRVMSSKRINAKCHTLKSGEVASSFSTMERQSTGSPMIRDAECLSAAGTCPEVVWWANGCGLVERTERGRMAGGLWVGERELGGLGWTWVEGRAGLGDHVGRLEGAMAFGAGAFARVAAPSSDGGCNEHTRGFSATTRYESILHEVQEDCVLHWTRVVRQRPRPRVTALLLWCKPLGGGMLRVKRHRLKGKDDPFGRDAFTTWEGGRSCEAAEERHVPKLRRVRNRARSMERWIGVDAAGDEAEMCW